MKMVKSLLLGTAAGLVAIAGAQAADLPVKAKPVQYVKICSLYGAGFYYIPGTDMCLKMGGFVRFEAGYGQNGNWANGPYTGDAQNRHTNNDTWRFRGYITADARNQSEYGTIRSYIAVGISTNSTGFDGASNQLSANRAFIQLAGFTFGVAQSFYDFYSIPASSLNGYFPVSDTGDGGWGVAGYTAQFGNGLSATLAAEVRRTTQIENTGGSLGTESVGSNAQAASLGSVAFGTAAFPGAYGGFNVPDIVANLRVDQAWGSAQIMGAVHEVNAQYYSPTTTPFLGTTAGHPSDAYGFAVGAGIKLLAPMIGPGDYFQAQVNYTEGALRYLFQNINGNQGFINGGNAAYGVLTDAVYGGTLSAGNATSLQLTTGWGVNAAYDHYWNKAWKTSAYGGYTAVSYNGLGNALLCTGGLMQSGAGGGAGSTSVALNGCNNNFALWFIGSRTQWNVSSDTYFALDFMYQDLQTAQSGFTGAAAGQVPITVVPAQGGGVPQTASNEGVYSVHFRVHRDFYP